MVYSIKAFEKKIPALLTKASIDPNLFVARSMIVSAVRASAMFPSTKANLSDASKLCDFVMFRELATTLYPRSRKALTTPAPIPCDPPVTIIVLFVFTTSELIVLLRLTKSRQRRVGGARRSSSTIGVI
jgi:hypothetical protein